MIDQDQANILMVDDQPGKLMTYEAILAPLGENLIKARSAREALDSTSWWRATASSCATGRR